MVRRVSRKVDNAAGEFTEVELFVVAEVCVKRLVKQRRVIKTIHRREEFLDLGDPSSDADGHLTAEAFLEVLRRGKVVGVRVCLTVHNYISAKPHTKKG